MFFFLFSSLWTPFTFKLHNFLISYSLLQECHLSWTNHLSTLIATEQHTKNFLGVQKLAFAVFRWKFVFLSSWPPLLWGAITFSFLIHFLHVRGCAKRRDSSFVWTPETTEPSPWIRPALPIAIIRGWNESLAGQKKVKSGIWILNMSIWCSS